LKQLTLSGHGRGKITRFVLGLGWSYFDARCLLRSKFTRHEAKRIKEGKISQLQRNLLFDDKYRNAKLKKIQSRMLFTGKP